MPQPRLQQVTVMHRLMSLLLTRQQATQRCGATALRCRTRGRPACQAVPARRAASVWHGDQGVWRRYIDIDRPAADAERGLQEFQIVTAAHSKPQALVALLDELRTAARGGGGVRVIVFAASLDVTRRLAALLHGCEGHLRLRTHELSSRVPQKEQAGVLEGLAASSDWCGAAAARAAQTCPRRYG